MSLTEDFIISWHCEEGVANSQPELLAWIDALNKQTYVSIKECSIRNDTFWFYDNYMGQILNRKRSFFSIKGIRYFVDERFIQEQPIIDQPEIGYLGIICKKIDGVLHFLMQAKIEPGNVNCVQISPTVQATKSNFTRAHGGKLPQYFDYFEQSQKYIVLYDQIQSEQSSRFYHKRNRNMLLLVNEDIPTFPNFKWMTLGQIKWLMKFNNLVNMDTRTVLSGIPFITEVLSSQDKKSIHRLFYDQALYRSIFETDICNSLCNVLKKVNDFKMFRESITAFVGLNQLVDWTVDEYGVTCLGKADFMVRYYDIEISGREVRRWTQPLFKAIGSAIFGLITKTQEGIRKFLVKIKAEIGTFDKVEIGPTVQWEPTHANDQNDAVEILFADYLRRKHGLLVDVLLSEEGGRFFHEQNRNIIIEIDERESVELPVEYVWVDYCALNLLVQSNNFLNIQLRNLLSLIKL